MSSPPTEDAAMMEIDATESKDKVSSPNPSASSETASKYPDMKLAQNIHRARLISANQIDEEAATEAGIPTNLPSTILSEILSEKVENPSLYKHIRALIPQVAEPEISADFLTEMETRLEAEYFQLEEKVAEAKENAGDMEVLDARFKKARFAAKSLSKDKALKAYNEVLSLPKLSSGKKIDALMETSRVASFYSDWKVNREKIDKAVKLALDGGDWDRRNRLKVYNALAKLVERDVKDASTLLIDCIATFSCSELCSYKDFVIYAILSNLMYLPRLDLKEKIIDNPEILEIVHEIPVVSTLMNSLYECDYKVFLQSMVALQPILLADRFLQQHAGYIMRELHVLGYKQFLDSYKSVTLESMASSFGVSCKFLDLQLSRFIAAGRLSAKIDKFGGVVETNRPDLKNAQYRDMIQKGDLLLNRIQKLARVVDL